jgi:hypothetical protein
VNVHPHIRKATKFIFDHYDPVKQWGWPIACGWVNWHACKGFMATIIDQQTGKIVAVGIARPVAKPSDGLIDYEYDEDGRHVFVDLILSTNPIGLAGIWAIFRNRFGERESISFFRHSETRLRTHNVKAMQRKVLSKKSYEPKPSKAA